MSLQQPGDPVRLARAVVELTRAEHPPLRLPLGSDTGAAIEAKHALVARSSPRGAPRDLDRLFALTGG